MKYLIILALALSACTTPGPKNYECYMDGKKEICRPLPIDHFPGEGRDR